MVKKLICFVVLFCMVLEAGPAMAFFNPERKQKFQRKVLRNVVLEVRELGEVDVNRRFIADYDVNGDGKINGEEAEVIAEHLGGVEEPSDAEKPTPAKE